MTHSRTPPLLGAGDWHSNYTMTHSRTCFSWEQVYAELARHAPEHAIVLDTTVVAIHTADKAAKYVELESGEKVPFDALISTMPVDLLLHMLPDEKGGATGGGGGGGASVSAASLAEPRELDGAGIFPSTSGSGDKFRAADALAASLAAGETRAAHPESYTTSVGGIGLMCEDCLAQCPAAGYRDDKVMRETLQLHYTTCTITPALSHLHYYTCTSYILTH